MVDNFPFLNEADLRKWEGGFKSLDSILLWCTNKNQENS